MGGAGPAGVKATYLLAGPVFSFPQSHVFICSILFFLEGRAKEWAVAAGQVLVSVNRLGAGGQAQRGW